MIYFSKNIYILLFLYFGISGAEAAGGFNQTDFTFAGAPKADKDMQIFDILQKLGNGLITSGRAISGIVIAVSGMMWILGANTNLFSSILKFAIGVSIITNIAWFVNSGYFFDLSGFFGTQPAFPSVKDITINLNTSWNFMGVFMVYYERVIIYASSQLMPYSLKLLGFLTILEMVSVLMFKQNGDHFHYLVHSVIKTGVFLFLLANWINGSTSIANSIFIFFEDMGIIATDFPGQVSTIGLGDENSSTALVAENILGNAAIIAKSAFGIDDAGGGGGTLNGIVDTAKGVYDVVANGKTNIAGSIANASVSLATIFVLIVTAGCLILTRLEFWTMALMALLLIPFGANQHTRFLFERVIGGALALENTMGTIKAHMRGIGGTMGNLKEYGKLQMPGRRTWSTAQSDYTSRMENDAERKDIARRAKEGQAWTHKSSREKEAAAQAEQQKAIRAAVSNEVSRSKVSNKTQQNVTKESISTETVSTSESINKTENIVRQGENKIDHTDRSMK